MNADALQDEAEDVHRKWLAAMRLGDFEAAWQQTDRIEHRRRARADQSALPGEIRWDGTPFHGKHVLIRCLHGLGDTLQFARFVPLVREQAAHVTFAVQPQLLPLFEGDPRFGDVCNGWTDNTFPDHDVELEVMELAYALRITAAELPGEIPYIGIEAIQQRSRWNSPFSPARPRVALLWQSSNWDPTRSIPMSALKCLQCNEVSFYGLQQNVPAADLETFPFPICSLARGTETILDAACAMLWMDLIITVDGMPAHLAGALRRPVWLLLKKEADWRWMTGPCSSPWYPSMRLFRQRGEGDWESVLRLVRAELDQAGPLTSTVCQTSAARCVESAT
jgi:hypothetical protein